LAEAVFGATGAVAATAVASDTLLTLLTFVAVAPVGAVAGFADVATASLPGTASAVILVVAVTMAAAVVVGAAAVVLAAVVATAADKVVVSDVVATTDVADPSLGCGAATPGTAAAVELVAIAAAAMTSGVELDEAEAATAPLAGATVTGIATAIAFSAATTLAPSCPVVADGSVAAAVLEASFPAGLVVAVFEVSDLLMDWEPDGWDRAAPLEFAALLEPAD